MNPVIVLRSKGKPQSIFLNYFLVPVRDHALPYSMDDNSQLFLQLATILSRPRVFGMPRYCIGYRWDDTGSCWAATVILLIGIYEQVL